MDEKCRSGPSNHSLEPKNFENLLFLSEGAEDTSKPADINEAAKITWVPLDSIRGRLVNGEILGAAAQIGLLHVLAR